MATPIDPLPEKELCAYEKLRDDIFKAREKAMIECGFFDELNKTKQEIGLESHIVEKKFMIKRNLSQTGRKRRKVNPTKQKEMYGEEIACTIQTDLMKNVMSF